MEQKTKNKKHGTDTLCRRGFTLIEIMVATALFAIVMMVGVGALLALVESNKRAQAINAVMNNVNAAMETMTRTVVVGRTYHCEATATPVPSPNTLATAQDCAASGGLLLAFESAKDGNLNDVNDQWVYRLNGTQIERSKSSGSPNSWVAMTAPEISITYLKFFVVGAPKGDNIQPRVLIVMKGTAPVPGGTTGFSIQSTVVQRALNI